MSEGIVAVRWLKDSPEGGHYIGDRVYRGRGPETTLEDKYIAGRHSRVEKIIKEGEVQELPAGVAEVLAQGGYVELVAPAEAPGAPAQAAHAKRGKGKA